MVEALENSSERAWGGWLVEGMHVTRTLETQN